MLDDLDVPLGTEMAAPNAARIFRALYPEFDRHRVDGTGHIVVPRGSPRLPGPSSGHVAHQIRDHKQPRSGEGEVMAAGQATGGRRRGVFEVDEDAALAELELAWADGGYHGFCVVDCSSWSAISSAGEVLTANTPDGLDQQIRAHWQALQ